MNTLEGTLGRDGESMVLQLEASTVPLPAALASAAQAANIERAVLGVRPEDLRFDTAGLLDAKVIVIESLGHEFHVVCRLDDGQMVIVRQEKGRRCTSPPTPSTCTSSTPHPARA